MPTPNQSSNTSQFILVGWIFCAVSLLAVLIGIVLCAMGSQLNGILTIVFGGIAVIIGLIVVFTARQQVKSIGAMSKGEGEIWARWILQPDDAARFLAAERKRLTISPGSVGWVWP